MTIVYRGMLPNAQNGFPQTGTTGNQLGVRDTDVQTYQQNGVPWVAPENNGDPQGVSVSPDSGCNLPPHRRPKGPPWNGTGTAGLVVWQFDTRQLAPAELSYQPDPQKNTHGFVSPGKEMPFQEYQDLVQGTAALWHQVAAPAAPCASSSTEGKPTTAMRAEELRTSVETAARTREAAGLIDDILAANGAGLTAADIVDVLQAGTDRFEADGDSEGAEVLREVLDRITGFCSPHRRVDLR